MQTIKNSRFSQRPSLRKIAITVCAAALPALGWAAPFAYQPEGDAALGGAKLGILDIATGQSTTQPLTDDFTSPSYISVNRAGTRVYLGGPFKSVVGIFDTRENSFSTVDIPNRGLIGIVSHPDSSRFYVGTSIGVLYEVNALSKSVRAFPVAGSLNGVAISKDGAYVYAASAIDGAVYAVNTTDGSVSRYLLGASPSGSIAVSPDGLHFYVALGDEPKLAVVSTATKNISTVPIGRGRAYTEGVAVSPVGDRVAVVNTTDGTLSIIDMSNRAAPSVTTVPSWQPQPRSVSFNDTGTRLFSVGAGANGAGLPMVGEYNPTNGEKVGTFFFGGVRYAGLYGDFLGPDVIGQPDSAFLNLPPVAGVRTQPKVQALASSQAACIVNTVANSLLDPGASYLGQGPDGVVKIGLTGGRRIAFYPVEGPNTFDKNPGLQMTSTNVVKVGSTCGKFGVVPAMNHLSDFGVMAQGLGGQVEINADGVMTMTLGDKTYVARPDFFVTPGGGGSRSLTQGADGNFRLNDSSGYTQILWPAFLDTSGLDALLHGPWGAPGSLTIQSDGTGLYSTTSGVQYYLPPDLTLTTAPESQGTLWSTGSNNENVFFRKSPTDKAQGFKVIRR